MRIVHVIEYFQPRLGYQETFLARAHAQLGHDVRVLTSDRYSPQVYTQNRAVLGRRVVGTGTFDEEGIRVQRLKTAFELPHAIWLRGLETGIQQIAPDLVIVHMIANLSAYRLARLKNRHPTFRLVYDDHMTSANSLSPLRALYPAVRWLACPVIRRAADSFVAILPETKEFMGRQYGIPPERIRVIPLGADDTLFRHDPTARAEVRRELSLSDADTLFIYTG
ncbi:MAG: glycosyltransferase, partial [Pseudomonadota bacterium]